MKKKKKVLKKKVKKAQITKVDKKRRTVTIKGIDFSPKIRKSFKEKDAYQEKLEIVLALTLQTAALELSKNEYVEMAPLPGMCGPFRLSGNSLPVIEYRVFDPRKNPFMMEFIKVRVEVSRPDRIEYTATIDSEGSQDAARHGEKVPVLEKYREPFEKLSKHLRGYFPFYRNPAMGRNPNRWDKPKDRVE